MVFAEGFAFAWSILTTCWVYYLGFFGSLLVTVYLLNPFPSGRRKPSKPPVPAGDQIQFTGREIPCHNPANGAYLGKDIAATEEEVNECVRLAAEAQKEWRNTSFDERGALLYDLMQYVVDHQEELAKASVQDTGKTMMEAYYGEILTTCEKLRHLIEYGRNSLKTEYRHVPLLLFLKQGRVEYHPLGVIGIIIPWNYPFHNAISAIAASIYAGNAAVVKVSEWATYSRASFVKIFREALAQRGHNPDLIQLIPGYGDTGAALCRCPLVSKILFIGSPQTGKRVMAAASENLTPVVLELGGKDPLIICKDAEWDHAVDVALRGVFVNAGQNCLAAERILVEREVYEKFCNEAVKVVRSMRQGCPPCKIHGIESDEMVDCGAITMPSQVQKIMEMVDDAVAQGATVIAGGHAADHLEKCQSSNSWFYPPTVISNVTRDMKIYQEEAFGPIMIVVAWSTDEEVISLANASEYGLGCTIMSNDYKRAERMGAQISSGMLTINDFGISYLIQSLPFGGCKISGFGRFNGVEGLREFSLQKTVVTDRFPIRTKAPRFNRYPVPKNATVVMSNAMTMLYSGQVGKKITSTINLIKAIIALEEPKLQ